MTISENQLKTWARFMQTQKAVNTHKIIRDVICSYKFSRDYEFENYLQGSYKNNTNIWADTDVDIVIQLNSVFRIDISKLTIKQQNICREFYSSASYNLGDFKQEVIKSLIDSFGPKRVIIGNKSIKVLSDSLDNVYDADVVICQQYRSYVPNEMTNTSQDHIGYYYEGIYFESASGEEIINYPKLHYKNGVEKHQYTEQNFKPIVRIFKNMRNAAVERGYLSNKNIAPSYFIQCLLYNVPDDVFFKNSSYQKIILDILNWLLEALDDQDRYRIFISQNGIIPLFGHDNDKWNINNSRLFLKSLIELICSSPWE